MSDNGVALLLPIFLSSCDSISDEAKDAIIALPFLFFSANKVLVANAQ